MRKKSKRFNKGKVEYHTMPLLGINELAKVSMFGGAKYDETGAPPNWKGASETSQHFNCSLRHWLKYMQGELLDDESKCYHLAHAAWNALAELEKILTGNSIDDRFPYKDLDLKKLFSLSEEQLRVNKEVLELKNKRNQKEDK